MIKLNTIVVEMKKRESTEFYEDTRLRDLRHST